MYIQRVNPLRIYIMPKTSILHSCFAGYFQRALTRKKSFPALFITMLLGIVLLSSCKGDHKRFLLLSGSENEPLEGIINTFAKEQGYDIGFQYKGSVDIMLELQHDTSGFDAVWPASGIWITLGDQAHKAPGCWVPRGNESLVAR